MEIYINNFNFDLSSWEWWVSTLIIVIIAYLFGSINSGQILSRYKNRDLGNTGSSNYGATNAGRTFGVYAFIIVFVGDFLKPIVLGMTFSILYYFTPFFNNANIPIALFFIFIGHVWPFWFGFRGGKGVAVFFGILTICNFIFSAIAGISFLIYFFIFRKVGLSSVLSILTSSFLISFQMLWPLDNTIFNWSRDYSVIILIWSCFIISFIKHIPNLISYHKNYIESKNKKEKENLKK